MSLEIIYGCTELSLRFSTLSGFFIVSTINVVKINLFTVLELGTHIVLCIFFTFTREHIMCAFIQCIHAILDF